MAARKTLRKRLPPGPAPGALGKRKSVAIRTPETTIAAYKREARRRKMKRSELLLEALLEHQKSFATLAK